MRRPGPSRQQGFGLLLFVIATAIVAFTIVVGYAGIMTRKQALDLVARQNAHLDASIQQIEKMWAQEALELDYTSAAEISIEDVLRLANVTRRGGMLAELSDVLTVAGEDIAYRAVVLYYPSETDITNPPDTESFRTSGVFKTCSDETEPCGNRVFRVFNSIDVERALAKETTARLQRVASKAQSYFKARMLQDPERNISVNYFRRPSGACNSQPQDLGCLDTYLPLVTTASLGTYTRNHIATVLGLNDEELFTAWGRPIEASNLLDSSTAQAPFSMAFRAQKPFGGFIVVRAVQPL